MSALQYGLFEPSGLGRALIDGGLALLEGATRSTAEERFELFGFKFADPWFLALIPVACFLVWRGREARTSPEAHVPSIGHAEGAPARTRVLASLPALLRMLSLSVAIVALARPLEGRDVSSTETEGLDIALLVDRSSSMEERESPRGPRRFDIVKSVVADFAERRMTDDEGARDSVALIGFAGFADLLVPFTLDVDALRRALDETEVELERRLDGTAIGQSVLQAVDALQLSSAKSKVVILLTDGRQTTGYTDPLVAAEAAAELGIRVYTVYAGPRERTMRSAFGDVFREVADVGKLPKIAEITDGRFFHAESAEELEEAYAAIETLERTPRVEDRFTERFDLYPRLLLPALFGYALSFLLALLFARRTP
ncbi:MAG: VWA domain-containing protein [Planctomycetota bacterium]